MVKLPAVGAVLVGAVSDQEDDVGFRVGEHLFGEQHELDAAEPVEQELSDGGGVVHAEKFRR